MRQSFVNYDCLWSLVVLKCSLRATVIVNVAESFSGMKEGFKYIYIFWKELL